MLPVPRSTSTDFFGARVRQKPNNQGPYVSSPNIKSAVSRAIILKEENIQKALENRTALFTRPKTVGKDELLSAGKEGLLIGGDLFNMLYLGFQGGITIAHASSAAIAWTTLALGCTGGIISIFISFVCLHEAIREFSNGNTQLGARLLLNFFIVFGIGIVMGLTALGAKVAALGILSTFFAAHPWVLPLLFLLLTLTTVRETISRLNQDLVADLKLEELRKALNRADQLSQDEWNQIFLLYGKNDPFNSNHVSNEDLIEGMIKLDNEMGVKAGLEALKLFECLLNEDKYAALKQCEKLEEAIADWNIKQWIRLAQQVLYIIAFGLSMGILRLSPASALFWGSIQNFSMAGANLIPLFVDILCPLERNCSLAVPQCEVKDLNAVPAAHDSVLITEIA